MAALTFRLMNRKEKELVERVALPISHQEVYSMYGYKRTLANVCFFYFNTKWSLKQVHEYIFYLHKFLFMEKFP